MDQTEDRLSRIEARLAALEARLSPQSPASTTPLPSRTTPSPLPPLSRPVPVAQPLPPRSGAGLSATTILGWGGVAALVLATAYLIRLAIDSGWLTPVRQVGMAGTFGVALIAIGLLMGERIRRYASLLPAGGIVVLFLTVYGAHLYHQLIGPIPAVIGVIAICLISLALRARFGYELYTFFAVIGSYTGPYLLHLLAARPMDLIIYFGAWDILFCAYALRAGRRSIYLLSAYLAFIVFDATWRTAEYSDWAWAAAFQAAQFVIFIAATVAFSIKHRSPLKEHEAVLHLPAVVFFYALEYGLLARHIHDTAPWLALASTLPLIMGYAVARMRLEGESHGGEQIVATYIAIALFHAGYLELLPDGWGALVGLGAIVALAIATLSAPSLIKRLWPLSTAFAVVAFLGYAQLIVGYNLDKIIGWRVLMPAYAAVLYGAYWLSRNRELPPIASGALLSLGHLCVMMHAVHLTESRFVVSIIWGLLAVTALVISMTTADRRLGRSSLAVFASFAAKVLLFDLSGAAPLVRIGCLVVLGVTMYVGGLLYQKIQPPPSPLEQAT